MLIYLNLIDCEEDISKFELLYNTYRQTMFYIANDILKDNHLAEDAVHTAFLRIIDNFNKINDVKSHKTKGLIVIIVKNISIDIYRKNKREREKLDILENEISINSNEHIELSELNELEIAISKLPEKYRQVILLKFSHHFSDNEIGNILKIKPDNVRKRISRGKEKLKSILKEMQVYNIE